MAAVWASFTPLAPLRHSSRVDSMRFVRSDARIASFFGWHSKKFDEDQRYQDGYWVSEQ
jgi:hypothetical protein